MKLVYCGEENVSTQIEHVVVVMLENRAFDHMLGKLYPKSESFNGLSGDEFNEYIDSAGKRHTVGVWNDLKRMNAPSEDPGEMWCDINSQLFGDPTYPLGKVPPFGSLPTMKGFLQNYYEVIKHKKPDDIMFHYMPEQTRVLSTLAKNYAVCDAWFSSAPCQTYPNRFFLHTGMPGHGQENNPPPIKLYDMPTIFNRFKDRNDWKIYGDDISPTMAFTKLWHYITQFQSIATFHSDAKNGTLSKYSFIECGYLVDLPNDQHPPYDIRYGEAFIAEIYNALQASPKWKNTMLVITYDEGGGTYDHEPPPVAPMPHAKKHGQKFPFDRYGTRVPAVVVSPYIKPGTIFRAKPGAQPFDHTSIIATLRNLFDLGGELTLRDKHAPNLLGLLSKSPDNLGVQIKPPELPEPMGKAVHPIGPLEKALLLTAAILPDMSEIQDIAEVKYKVEEHIKNLLKKELDLIDIRRDRSFIKKQLYTTKLKNGESNKVY
jgi:phospholipase C